MFKIQNTTCQIALTRVKLTSTDTSFTRHGTRLHNYLLSVLQLRRNRRLDRFFIRDFNKEPNNWAEKDNTFDAVVCCVSVQYMQQPECVFAEIQRVLKPGGVCIITFSSRLFYSKAIQGWRDNSAFGRISLVKQYFQCVKGVLACAKLQCHDQPSLEIVSCALMQGSLQQKLSPRLMFPQSRPMPGLHSKTGLQSC